MDAALKARRVAVLGGGITGLSAAFRLLELAVAHEVPLKVTLFESGNRLGGALDTIRRDAFTLEGGADSFLSEKPAAVRLADRLGLSAELVGTQEQFRKTQVVRAGRLVEIPPGFSLLAPTRLWPIIRSPLFSPWGKFRIALEPFIPRRRAVGDESMAAFVKRRLGRETLIRIAQPLAAGIYTADPEKLSAAATMPRFVEMERRYGSVIRGLRAAAAVRDAGGVEARSASGARWSLFLSFKGGMRALVDALAARLNGSIRVGARVIGLAPSGAGAISGAAAHGWTVRIANDESVEADAVVCALPAYAAAMLLQPHEPALASRLAEIEYASAATVNLAFRMADFPNPPLSFGFVVPVAEHRRIIAGSFSSLKFPGRAPVGMVLARVFMGGALQTEIMQLDDMAMIGAAREEFAALLGVNAPPMLVHLQRWPAAMPQYVTGHLDRIAAIEREAAAVPGVALAGPYLRGVGIPDCISSGEQAAEAIFSHIMPSGT